MRNFALGAGVWCLGVMLIIGGADVIARIRFRMLMGRPYTGRFRFPWLGWVIAATACFIAAALYE